SEPDWSLAGRGASGLMVEAEEGAGLASSTPSGRKGARASSSGFSLAARGKRGASFSGGRDSESPPSFSASSIADKAASVGSLACFFAIFRLICPHDRQFGRSDRRSAQARSVPPEANVG